MIAYVLEYDWLWTRMGWRLRSEGYQAVEEDFHFRKSDACFPHATLTPDSFQEMKAYLDPHGLKPRVLNVLPSGDWGQACCVLRFQANQENEAALTKLFCS